MINIIRWMAYTIITVSVISVMVDVGIYPKESYEVGEIRGYK